MDNLVQLVKDILPTCYDGNIRIISPTKILMNDYYSLFLTMNDLFLDDRE